MSFVIMLSKIQRIEYSQDERLVMSEQLTLDILSSDDDSSKSDSILKGGPTVSIYNL